jgi:hypothetical protein
MLKMDAKHWQVIDTMVQSALAMDIEERTAFLDAACTKSLRTRVENLIAEAERSDSFLEKPAFGEFAGLTPDPQEASSPAGLMKIRGQRVGQRQVAKGRRPLLL